MYKGRGRAQVKKSTITSSSIYAVPTSLSITDNPQIIHNPFTMIFNMKQTHLLPALDLAATLVHTLPATKTSNLEARQGPQPALPYPFGFNADTCPPDGNLFTYGIFQTVDNSGSGSKRSFDGSDPGMVPLQDEAKRSLSPRQKETDA